jgi:hypothetical protein
MSALEESVFKFPRGKQKLFLLVVRKEERHTKNELDLQWSCGLTTFIAWCAQTSKLFIPFRPEFRVFSVFRGCFNYMDSAEWYEGEAAVHEFNSETHAVDSRAPVRVSSASPAGRSGHWCPDRHENQLPTLASSSLFATLTILNCSACMPGSERNDSLPK